MFKKRISKVYKRNKLLADTADTEIFRGGSQNYIPGSQADSIDKRSVKVYKMHPCEDCKILIKGGAAKKRCGPCSDKHRMEYAYLRSKKKQQDRKRFLYATNNTA